MHHPVFARRRHSVPWKWSTCTHPDDFDLLMPLQQRSNCAGLSDPSCAGSSEPAASTQLRRGFASVAQSPMWATSSPAIWAAPFFFGSHKAHGTTTWPFNDPHSIAPGVNLAGEHAVAQVHSIVQPQNMCTGSFRSCSPNPVAQVHSILRTVEPMSFLSELVWRLASLWSSKPIPEG
jgi:hypothetical protein